MLTPDVGYSNCTTAINMATHVHYDLSQILTATLSVDVSALAMLLNREELLGGHHIVTDASNKASVVFLEGAWGQLLLGPYQGILHGNMAVLRGQRLLITFYCKTTILDSKPWEAEDEAFYFPCGRSGADGVDSDTDVVDGGSDADE